MDIVRPLQDFTEHPEPWVFLAGGMSGWRDKIEVHLEYFNRGTIINPGNPDFPETRKGLKRQIGWECAAITHCHIFAVFFAGTDSDQPISLHEFGLALGNRSDYFDFVVGVDNEYNRRQNIDIRAEIAGLDLHDSPNDVMLGIADAVYQFHHQ